MKRLLAVMCCLLLAGCANDEENVQAWMNQQAQGMRGMVKPLPEIKPFPVVEYAADDLPSPFDPARLQPERRAGGALQPDLTRRREPLEAYPLESLQMVGVLQRKGVTEALVKADQRLHQVRVGNHMGQNFGVVTGIDPSGITLKELVQDVNGDWVERSTTLMLQEPEGAAK